MKIFSQLTAGFAVFFVLTVLSLWVALPFFIDFKVKKNSNLGNNTNARLSWEKTPFPIEFRVYLFNVTNYNDIAHGAKPILQQIGPYIYDEWKEKKIISENEKDDTISFYMKNTYIFNLEKSNNLTGNELIIMPHPLIAAAGNEFIFPAFYDAINVIFNNTNGLFLKLFAKDILFDGINVNCNTSDTEKTQLCQKLKSEFFENEDGVLKYSLFGPKNATILPGLIKVKRGVKFFKQVGRVVQYNDQNKLNVWHSDGSCNNLIGTDSTIFAPFLPTDEDIYIFLTDFCTSFKMEYQEKIIYKKISAGKYNITLRDMSTNKDQKCYCTKKKNCLKKGALDITKCVNKSLIVTLPHFYDSDNEYLKAITGLSPIEENHSTFMKLEMNFGSPVYAAKRFQFNIPIKSNSNISEIIFPLFWFEEIISPNQTYLDSFLSLQKLVRISGTIKWAATAIFGIGLLFSIAMMYIVEVLTFDKEMYNAQNSPDFSSSENSPVRERSTN